MFNHPTHPFPLQPLRPPAALLPPCQPTIQPLLSPFALRQPPSVLHLQPGLVQSSPSNPPPSPDPLSLSPSPCPFYRSLAHSLSSYPSTRHPLVAVARRTLACLPACLPASYPPNPTTLSATHSLSLFLYFPLSLSLSLPTTLLLTTHTLCPPFDPSPRRAPALPATPQPPPNRKHS